MRDHIIKVNKLNYMYPDGNEALREITFNIKKGESIGIIGSNGSGKSTLLMNLVGVAFANSGEICIDNIPVQKKTLKDIRRKIGMVFQNSDEQLFMTTVYDDVAFGPRNYKLSEDEVEFRVKASLEKVGISHLINKAPYKLSGGEKRSVAIATVLAMYPDVLLMDEPTTALDPRSRRRFINLLKDFSHTKIITSHDLDMILELCDRVIVLNEGCIVADKSTLSVFEDDELMQMCGLEKPLSMQNCYICGSRKKVI